MVEQAAPVLWVVVAVVAATVAVRGRRRPEISAVPTALAVGAVFGAVAGFVGAGIVVQLACLVGVTLVLAVVFVRWRVLAAENRLPPGVGGNRLVGMDGTVEALVSGDPAAGRVRVGTETWRAITADDRDVTPGAPVTVVAVRGNVAVVEVDEDDAPTPEMTAPTPTSPGPVSPGRVSPDPTVEPAPPDRDVPTPSPNTGAT